jgi:Mg-chelatase subunit ChlD
MLNKPCERLDLEKGLETGREAELDGNAKKNRMGGVTLQGSQPAESPVIRPTSELHLKPKALSAGYSTRLGAALRHAGAGLASQPTHRRLLLLVTDGEPSDIDCPDPRYLLEDARRAVQSLAARGMDVFCLAPIPKLSAASLGDVALSR